ncbi:MAG: formate dehydrogenase accessory sulfurtransferase FdhD [Xanthobacteraceae bacterium]|jgi:FdhD protein
MREPTKTVACSLWRQQGAADGKRIIPEETAVAFTYDGGTYAVMMATPQNLEDFALGFSVTEGLVCSPADIRHLDIIELDAGIELRMWLTEPHAAALSERRRHLAGPTGCGLCGIESLDEAVRPPARVRDGDIFTPAEIMRALDALAPRQELNRLTRAVHAAAFWQPGTGLLAVREDVGRHNALDKLAGALTRDRVPGHTGLVLLTSRVSVEMVQKTAAIGAPLIVAVSAPTALAVRTAEAAGITLVAVARGDGFEIFTHPQRIKETTKETVINVA